MIPFWSMGGTLSKVTIISVDDKTVAMTLEGGLSGASEINNDVNSK